MKLIKFLLSKGVIYAVILAVFYQIAMVGTLYLRVSRVTKWG